MKSIANRIVSLSVGAKIAVIMALMMLPIGHLTLLFVKQVRKDVAFSSLEVTGARLLTDVWGALAVSAAPGSSPERTSTAARLVSAQQSGAVSLGAGDFSAAFARALLEGHEQGKIWEAGQVAIQKIADGSNLTLDPDVDSYYVMDVVAVRLPELIIARAHLDQAMQPALGGSGKLTARQYGVLVQATTRYEIALGAVQSSLVSAVGGNADGSLAAALATVRDRFTRAADLVAQQATALREQHAQERPLQLARSEAESAATEFAAAADALWRAGQVQLLRLIETRIDGFESNAIRDLTIAALAALAAFGCALAFVRTIRNPISDLLKTMRRFQLNDFSEPVPHIALSNEIGEIARALDRGKHDAERSALTIAAMNQSPTMLMITDPEENITFISASLVAMLMRFEPTFRAVRHDFAVEKMVGEHLDYYRANPNLSRKLLIDNGEVRKVRYDIADETVLVDMAYIFAADGSKIGHALVWRNVTAELLGEAEIAAVVGAAQQGDFSARLPIENKEGFVREIANGLNNVSALVEKATGEFAEVMDAVAGANLTRSVTGHYQGVLGSLKNSINATVEHLASTVQTIQITSADVGLAAREINMGADDLSKRTEEQASSLEETAATTEQLAASVKATAQASRQAAATADEAMKVALNGGAIANQAVDAMARIETASTKISDITRVIDDIAFQTNLLALNAAVEAARAGDAGKGFAVVASEVRTLAQRSSEAAKDISALISSTNMEVGEGVKLVRRAGEALSQILGASQRVAGTIADISAASGEQANGIDEMSQAVAHLDEMTQANAALAEQSAASATSLSGRIEQLNDLVAAFKTRSESDMSRSASEPARLRLLAEAAFVPRKAAARRTAAFAGPTSVMPVKKVANSRAGDAGWEEF